MIIWRFGRVRLNIFDPDFLYFSLFSKLLFFSGTRLREGGDVSNPGYVLKGKTHGARRIPLSHLCPTIHFLQPLVVDTWRIAFYCFIFKHKRLSLGLELKKSFRQEGELQKSTKSSCPFELSVEFS